MTQKPLSPLTVAIQLCVKIIERKKKMNVDQHLFSRRYFHDALQ